MMTRAACHLVKICGLSTPETVEAALAAGADMVGFVCYPRSPRHVSTELGRVLSAAARGRATRVVLLVDPDDAALDADVTALDPDLIQLHGRETPERVAAIRARYGRPVMKAVGIAGAADLATASRYAGAADRILLDAKAPSGGLPGGNGVAFDWAILAESIAGAPSPLAGEGGLRVSEGRMRGAGSTDPSFVAASRRHLLPRGEKERAAGCDPVRLMLSGGLTPGNVAEAIRTSGLRAVDVSSGVETAPGLKHPRLIADFIREARAAFAAHTRERAVA